MLDADEDILDAHDRLDARDLVSQAGDGNLDPVSAQTIVETPRRRWVNPYVALLDEITRTQAFIVLLELEVRELDAAGGAHRSGRRGINLLQRFDRERDRLISACKTAISLGIAERQVRLAEKEGELMTHAVIAAIDAVPNIAPETRRELLTNLAHQLRAAGGHNVNALPR